MIRNESLQLLEYWGLTPGRLLRDIELAGSPQRCRKRVVVQDAAGGLWILEQLLPGQAGRRARIARALEALAPEFPLAPAYRRTLKGEGVLASQGRSWQLAPFVQHEELPRPAYLHEAGMGASLGDCLAQLRRAAALVPAEASGPLFDLPGYIRELLHTLRERRPDVAYRAEAAAAALAPLEAAWDTLPRAFCHGDCHPLNALWSHGRVVALIDWEFCGPRPRLYDLATCLGCVGVEDPAALGGRFARGLLEGSGEPGDEEAGELLPELVLALRFGWLSEWLRNDDEPMVTLELDYMELLASNLGRLRGVWT